MYQVFGIKQSRAMRVLWTLEEIGAPYALIESGPRSDKVRDLNPSGKIPVMKDGDAVLTDSTAIVTYLADKHGDLTHPPGTVARAQQDGLSQMILDELDAVLWASARHSFVLPAELRMPAIKDSLRWEWAQNLQRLSDRIAGPFLMGETMTIADIICTHCLNWGASVKFEITPDPLRAYHERMRERPALQRLMA